ncbi:MAG: radical SAM protein [Bacteroidetes bacterium MedPE-SWsnd-G2]|nr:MAG: radical SAM protein [Bacteroidetes bacterium MedPE-SWsnd-G2]
MKDILLVTPPFTQLNTPYPATAYLKGFLNTKGLDVYQMDLGIEVILELFSEDRFKTLFDFAYENDTINTANGQRIYALRGQYLKYLDAVVLFLQGHNPTLARLICMDAVLPQASRFDQIDDLEFAFGQMGMQDKAKHLATLFLEDLSDFIVECIDDNFGFSRYAERLGQSANNFDELYNTLKGESSIVDQITIDILKERLALHKPKMLCFSVPFPGNLYSAFKCAQYVKQVHPDITIVMGGGFPNTELRSLTDIRVFEFFDCITLDDGELPLELVYKAIDNNVALNASELKRTLILNEGKVEYFNNAVHSDYKQSELGTPDYSDLPLGKYISVIEITNPMHSLWSDGRWNKLTMAHGCYWGKCTFCDISLDYIKIYEPIAASILVDRMETIIDQTGDRGFHFVDEAAPPALMKALALEILRRQLTVTWWTNIRFEKNFTKELCVLLKASGCIAVSGGLEVASDRLLKLIDKGVTVSQVAQVTRNFTESGIMVHSYLMYGFPSQTIQETIDSLEMVRQLFELGVMQSGFWHQFALTAHSPIGHEPEAFGVKPLYNAISFANNDVAFEDATAIDHSKFSYGLKKSLFNYMHGIGFDIPVEDWFDFGVPESSIHPDFIYDALQQETVLKLKPNAKVVWLGNVPFVEEYSKTKKGMHYNKLRLTFHDNVETFQLNLDEEKGDWLLDVLESNGVLQSKHITLGQLKKNYETQFEDFELFWFSKSLQGLRAFGLLVL